MKLQTVYNSDGICLGENWMDLSWLQEETKDSIRYLIYMDGLVESLNDEVMNLSEVTAENEIMTTILKSRE